MFTLKSLRIILILIGVVIGGSLFLPPIHQPAVTGAAAITPPARDSDPPPPPPPPPNGSSQSNGGKEDAPAGAIYGQVIDLSTGQPAQGLEIDINGNIVRTDSEGQYSLTGLEAGTYTAVLILPSQATAEQSSTTIQLAENETVTVDLNYYSDAALAPTPTNTPEPTPTPAPVEAATVNQNVPTTGEVAPNFSPLTPHTGGSPVLWINPGHINNEEGVAGNITIDVANVSDLGAFQATLKFNPKIIEVGEVQLGNFLESTGRETNPLVIETDNTTGEISFVAYTSGNTAGPNGGGTLAIVNFVSKQAGVSDLDLDNVLLVARLGKTIGTEVGDGRVSVSTCFGDLNGDDQIDVSDVQAVAGRVGQSLGDPNYVLVYDLTNDNVIDEEDVVLVTERLYETCP